MEVALQQVARVPALPVGAGTSLKPEHWTAVLETADRPAFFEVHAENFLCAGGPAHRHLEAIRRDCVLSMHGVGLSLGGPAPPPPQALAARRALVDRYEPAEFSEHLAWSRLGNAHFNDLLPLAYDEAALARVGRHVEMLQEALGRRVLIENPATYVQFSDSTLAETQFLGALADRTGCGLLLDLNNIVVSAVNHAFNAGAYLDAFPLRQVAQIHLAGHALKTDRHGQPLCIDSHDGPVQAATWSLFDALLARRGALPVLIEWDGNLPDWPTLRAQAQQAELRMRTQRELTLV